jgi:uncharacterized protein YggE
MPRWTHLVSVLAVAATLSVAATSVEAQDSSTEPFGITVIGYGEASAPAEAVSLQILVTRQDFGPPSAPSPGDIPGEEERELVRPVVAALVAEGIAEEDVAVVVSPSFSGFYGPAGPGVARVDLTVEGADQERVNALVDAATIGAAEERLFVGQVGVRYEVADCRTLERTAREAAIADAQERAEIQAELLGVDLGEVIASSDAPVASAPAFGYFGPVAPDAGNCAPPTATIVVGPVTFAPFDPTAPAEVEVYAQMSVTFAFEGPQTVTGTRS